jgi:uncharacterized protein (DUF1697 family)
MILLCRDAQHGCFCNISFNVSNSIRPIIANYFEMQTYISFLRGVNMTGHNSIKMTDLSALYNSMGFADAEPYIQSGNVIFTDPGKRSVSSISEEIEKSILERFGYIVPAMIRTKKQLIEIISSNPYKGEPDFDPTKLAVIFLHDEPSDTQIQKVAHINYPPDKFKIIGNEIIIYCPNGFGRTKIYTNFFEKKMDVIGTARNWKTITTIINIIEKKI